MNVSNDSQWMQVAPSATSAAHLKAWKLNSRAADDGQLVPEAVGVYFDVSESISTGAVVGGNSDPFDADMAEAQTDGHSEPDANMTVEARGQKRKSDVESYLGYMGCQAKNADICEPCSVPRIGLHARDFHLKQGFPVDIANPTDGCDDVWQMELADKMDQSKLIDIIKQRRPGLLVASPMCTAMSVLQAMNDGRRDPAVVGTAKDVLTLESFSCLDTQAPVF